MPEPLYEVSRFGRIYYLRKIRRVPLKLVNGTDVVRYERHVQPVHSKESLKKFMGVKKRMAHSRFNYLGREFRQSDELLPFIKTWEKNLGRYATFGVGGW